MSDPLEDYLKRQGAIPAVGGSGIMVNLGINGSAPQQIPVEVAIMQVLLLIQNEMVTMNAALAKILERLADG